MTELLHWEQFISHIPDAALGHMVQRESPELNINKIKKCKTIALNGFEISM